MTANIIAIIGLCITAAVFCKVLEKTNKEQALMLSIGTAVAALGLIVVCMMPLIEVMNTLFDKAGSNSEYCEIIIKSLGICYVTQLGCDVCRDCGENTLSTIVEAIGKISLLLLALPLFEKLIGIVSDMLQTV